MKIAFFDVEETDKPAVVARFPDALILDPHLSEEEIATHCADCEIIVTFVTTAWPATLIARLPALKLLCARSVGVDHIDTASCKARGMTVTRVPDYGAHVVAEHAFALLLSGARMIPQAHARVKAGRFDYHGLRGIALKEKTIGIIGTGKIGQAAARIAKGFGMRILGYDPYPAKNLPEETGLTYVSLEELLAQSDIISLHAPSLPENKHMLNDAAFARMKDGTIFVNTARGAIVDPDALMRALDSGKIGLALLDVLEHEDHPEQSKKLIEHANTIITPHIAFYADHSVKAMYDDCFMSIEEWIDGKKPSHIVL